MIEGNIESDTGVWVLGILLGMSILYSAGSNLFAGKYVDFALAIGFGVFIYFLGRGYVRATSRHIVEQLCKASRGSAT